jgi:hypothetical protein
VQIRLERLLGALRQEVVLSNELFQLRLHGLDLLGGELKLDDRDAGGLEMAEEANLVRLQEHQTSALVVGASGCSADAVNVVGRIVRRIELDNEIDGRDLWRHSQYTNRACSPWLPSSASAYIQATGSNISADENAVRGVAELEESVGSLLLLLLPVKI